MNLWGDDRNPGKNYREYLAEAYGGYKAKKLIDPKSQSIINGLKRKNERDESGQ